MPCCKEDGGIQTRNDTGEERLADRRDRDKIISRDVGKNQFEHVKIQVVCRDHVVLFEVVSVLLVIAPTCCLSSIP